mmetsp:Transcript_71792/g.162922  ORF Transcript_71792/g.162922 Transcript_71792/m.162922 type:complete len:262 (+) Transcript_71792:55-840(+)
MFGGKKLKDLTEEDIRRYAASLSSQKAPEPAEEEEEEAEPAPPPRPAPVIEQPAEASAPSETRKIAEAIAERSVRDDEAAESRSRAVERVVAEESARKEPELTEEERQERAEAERLEIQARLSEEEQLRLEVLAELDRSQMPAVHQEDGLLLKTIEHYTFADSNEVATISIELDKDLFEGAAAHVSADNIEVTTNESDVTILLHGVPAAKAVAAPADWRLHLSPLFHTVDPDGTTFKLRKGKVSVKLKKKKPQEWRRILKF